MCETKFKREVQHVAEYESSLTLDCTGQIELKTFLFLDFKEGAIKAGFGLNDYYRVETFFDEETTRQLYEKMKAFYEPENGQNEK